MNEFVFVFSLITMFVLVGIYASLDEEKKYLGLTTKRWVLICLIISFIVTLISGIFYAKKINLYK